MDLAPIEERANEFATWVGKFDSTQRIPAAFSSAADVPALIAEVKRLRSICEDHALCADTISTLREEAAYLRAEASAQGSTQREPFLCFAAASRALSLLPGRSEAEVKAEALREARDAVRASSFWADGSDNYADRVRGYLSARADRLAAEGGADRG